MPFTLLAVTLLVTAFGVLFYFALVKPKVEEGERTAQEVGEHRTPALIQRALDKAKESQKIIVVVIIALLVVLMGFSIFWQLRTTGGGNAQQPTPPQAPAVRTAPQVPGLALPPRAQQPATVAPAPLPPPRNICDGVEKTIELGTVGLEVNPGGRCVLNLELKPGQCVYVWVQGRVNAEQDLVCLKKNGTPDGEYDPMPHAVAKLAAYGPGFTVKYRLTPGP